MSEILLVHGSCHGAWCWRDVIPALEGLGHDVRAIDLPGHGANPCPIEDITLDRYARAVLDAIDSRAVVVGHSMAGFPISAAAETDPDKIARLIYLCAYAPRDGVSLVDMRVEAPRQPLLEAIEKTGDGLGFTFRDMHLAKALYHDCPEGTVDYARDHLCVQAVRPQATAISLGASYARTPKAYIRCDDDQAVPPEYQRTMTTGWPDADVHALPAGHSPFFSMPERLAQLIGQIARQKS
jgi:pimeloyl-ACP methyl ester carboxylesterase